jgi:hypothetical protein
LAHIGQARGWAAVAFGGSRLELTTARAEGAEVTVVQEATASAAPPEAAADAPLQWQYAAQSLRQQFDPREHRVVTSVDCGDVLCQILRLPATDPAELKQMLDLQIDNITPLPLEEVVYSFEPLDVVDGQTRVLVAIARKATVNERVEALETAGLQAEIVSVDALAMFRALGKRNSAGDGRQSERAGDAWPGYGRRDRLFPRGDPGRPVDCAWRGFRIDSPGRTAADVRCCRSRPAAARPGRRHLPDPRRTGDIVCRAGGERTEYDDVVPDEWRGAVARTQPVSGMCGRWRSAPVEPAAGRMASEAADGRVPPPSHSRGDCGGGRLCGGVGGVPEFPGVEEFTPAPGGQRDPSPTGRVSRRRRNYRAQLLAMSKQLDLKYSALEVLRGVAVLLPDNVKLTSFVYKKDQTVTIKGQAPTQPWRWISKADWRNATCSRRWWRNGPPRRRVA